MSMRKCAFITGVTGQDGSYLSEFLLAQGYEVHGILRRSSMFTTGRIDHLRDNPHFHLHHGDLNDSSSLFSLLARIEPDEVYHLGAQSHVGVSFEVPEYTGDVTGLGTLRLLNALKSIKSHARFYNAGTSEMFGGLVGTSPQSEVTPFHPRSPYGAAKLYSYWITVNYREAFGLHASSGILFNHESPRRGETFVTRKITKGVASYLRHRKVLSLGNLNAVRDWGFAGDYIEAMWLMLQNDKPTDFVVATGRPSTVRQFADVAFSVAGVDLDWEGEGLLESAFDRRTGEQVVKVDPKYFRPAEVEYLLGNANKAHEELGWKPKTTLESLIEMMVKNDIDCS